MNVETATPTPPKLKADNIGYSNLDSMLQCPQEARKDIENWLAKVPNYSDPSLGFSNLAAMKNDVLQPEVARQKRMGFL
jgi:hypothetical protein